MRRIITSAGIAVVLYLCFYSSSHTSCYPKLDSHHKHVLIGYGSLVNAASRLRTEPDAVMHWPVYFRGYSRDWSAQSSSATYLGLRASSTSDFVNGIAFFVNETSMHRFDLRESIYCRVSVSSSDVRSVAAKGDLTSAPVRYWTYVTRDVYYRPSDEQHSIRNTYVQTYINGCMQVSHAFNLTGFLHDCIRLTRGWDAMVTG